MKFAFGLPQERIRSHIPGEPIRRSLWLHTRSRFSALLLSSSASSAATVTLRPQGSAVVDTDIVTTAAVGTTVTIEAILDTQGLSFAGYSYGLDIAGGAVSGLSHTYQPLNWLRDGYLRHDRARRGGRHRAPG